MTPKEKAKELVWKYLPILESWKEVDSSKAKQCALIAVDELKKTNPFEKDFIYNGNAYYWNEVKREILSL